MPKIHTDKLNKTDFAFTSGNVFAQAIGDTAQEYPQDVIKVSVTPIESDLDVMNAFLTTVDPDNRPGLNKAKKHLFNYYKELGLIGTHSLVEINVPEGAGKFKFQDFYNQVRESLQPENL